MPNIAIYEGGKAARMNGVSVITTDDGNDGKITWVPQSERQTGTLYVSENGTYRAEDEGLHSWSKVTVRLAGAPLGLEVPTLPDPITGAEIPTGELGELEPVAPAGLEPIEDEPISVDEAENILEEAGLDPSDLESDDALEAIADALGTDPEDVKVIDPEKKEDVKENQPKPSGNGQQIKGTDPETGAEKTIGINPDGTVTTEAEIAGMRIYQSLDKLVYNDGDSIDFHGLKVALLDSNGNTIRIVSWPDSGIGTPVTVASMESVDGIDVRYGDELIGISGSAFVETTSWGGDRGSDITYTVRGGGASITRHSSNGVNFLISSKVQNEVAILHSVALPWHIDSSGAKVYDEDGTQGDTELICRVPYGYAGKTAWRASISIGWTPRPKEVMAYGISNNDATTLDDGMLSWVMLYGDYQRGIQDVPVTYGDFTDIIQIWVN